MTKRLTSFRLTAVALLLATGVIVAVLLLVIGRGATPAIAAAVAVQRACDAMETDHFDADVIMTDTELRFVQTWTFAGNDSRLVSHSYPHGSTTLYHKADLCGRTASSTTASAPITTRTLGEHGRSQTLAGDVQAAYSMPAPGCCGSEGASGTSQERHFVWKVENLGDTVETDEFWAGTNGVPVRALFTLAEATPGGASGASGQSTTHANKILRTIAIDYSGFGETNTVTAPIAPPTPGAPRDLTPTAGDGQVILDFYDPLNPKPAITGYEYRQRTGDRAVGQCDNHAKQLHSHWPEQRHAVRVPGTGHQFVGRGRLECGGNGDTVIYAIAAGRGN